MTSAFNDDTDLDADLRKFLSLAAELIRRGENLDALAPPHEDIAGRESIAALLDRLSRSRVGDLRVAAGLAPRKRGGRKPLTQMQALKAVATAATWSLVNPRADDYLEDAAEELGIDRRTLERRIALGRKQGLIKFGVDELRKRLMDAMPAPEPPEAPQEA